MFEVGKEFESRHKRWRRVGGVGERLAELCLFQVRWKNGGVYWPEGFCDVF